MKTEHYLSVFFKKTRQDCEEFYQQLYLQFKTSNWNPFIFTDFKRVDFRVRVNIIIGIIENLCG